MIHVIVWDINKTRFIDAGSFSTREEAQARLTELNGVGMDAEIIVTGH
jgi:hypothetical protein